MSADPVGKWTEAERDAVEFIQTNPDAPEARLLSELLTELWWARDRKAAVLVVERLDEKPPTP